MYEYLSDFINYIYRRRNFSKIIFFNNIIYLLNSDFYVLYYLIILISKWIYDYIFKINN